MTTLDTDKHYRVEGYGGVAFYTLGHPIIKDGEYYWTGIETEDTEYARMVMVGDDTVHIIPVEDLTPIDEDEFCPECGQIGCKAYG